MVEFTRFTLDNGLTVLLHPEPDKYSAAVNILYRAGTIYEEAGYTGLAHLFEHLMFTGTPAVPSYDVPLQKAGGENNAFTCSDYATYYSYGPAVNLPLYLSLEADRMRSLMLREKEFNVQRKVVIEEFYETCTDEPYGDLWHQFGDMVYPDCPYNIPVIGRDVNEIQAINLDRIKQWYAEMYSPSNAILAVSGRFDVNQVTALINAEFGSVPRGKGATLPFNTDNFNTELSVQKSIKSNVPADAIFMGFPIARRSAREYYSADLWTEILSGGKSSRLYERLINKEKLLYEVEVYTNDVAGPGVLIIEGKCNRQADLQKVEQCIWAELEKIKSVPIPQDELKKAVNKTLTTIEFSEYSTVNKAINLCYFEFLGDARLINSETAIYHSITTEDLIREANTIFQTSHAKTLFYLKNGRRKKT